MSLLLATTCRPKPQPIRAAFGQLADMGARFVFLALHVSNRDTTMDMAPAWVSPLPGNLEHSDARTQGLGAGGVQSELLGLGIDREAGGSPRLAMWAKIRPLSLMVRLWVA